MYYSQFTIIWFKSKKREIIEITQNTQNCNEYKLDNEIVIIIAHIHVSQYTENRKSINLIIKNQSAGVFSKEK